MKCHELSCNGYQANSNGYQANSLEGICTRHAIISLLHREKCGNEMQKLLRDSKGILHGTACHNLALDVIHKNPKRTVNNIWTVLNNMRKFYVK